MPEAMHREESSVEKQAPTPEERMDILYRQVDEAFGKAFKAMTSEMDFGLRTQWKDAMEPNRNTAINSILNTYEAPQAKTTVIQIPGEPKLAKKFYAALKGNLPEELGFLEIGLKRDGRITVHNPKPVPKDIGFTVAEAAGGELQE